MCVCVCACVWQFLIRFESHLQLVCVSSVSAKQYLAPNALVSWVQNLGITSGVFDHNLGITSGVFDHNLGITSGVLDHKWRVSLPS